MQPAHHCTVYRHLESCVHAPCVTMHHAPACRAALARQAASRACTRRRLQARRRTGVFFQKRRSPSLDAVMTKSCAPTATCVTVSRCMKLFSYIWPLGSSSSAACCAASRCTRRSKVSRRDKMAWGNKRARRYEGACYARCEEQDVECSTWRWLVCTPRANTSDVHCVAMPRTACMAGRECMMRSAAVLWPCSRHASRRAGIAFLTLRL